MEAVAAVGLSGNIVQFVQFTCELLSLSSNIKNSIDGLTSSHSDIEAVAQHLEHFSKTLSTPCVLNQGLTDLARRSQAVAQDLLAAIEGVRFHNKKGQSKCLANFRQSLKIIWKQDRIEKLILQAKLLCEQLVLYLASESRDMQRQSQDVLADIQNENSQQQHLMSIQLRDTIEKLEKLKDHVLLFLPNQIVSQITNHLSEKDRKEKSHAILSSLEFETMSVRYSQIQEAHKRTFEWIFSTELLPASDPRSKISYSSWLKHGSGMFWITGKPGMYCLLAKPFDYLLRSSGIGSGKSTLMKFLDYHPTTWSLLKQWAGPRDLVTGSFYFWNAGTTLQKSLQGLLQSLLYEVLSRCPTLIPIICQKRWEDDRTTRSTSPWSIEELKSTLERIKSCTLSLQFYFHVDGLDEYEGTDHGEIIATLQDIATSPIMKLCVSSRPWNCFNDTIGQSNMGSLRLHDLTREDIRIFAKERILSYVDKARDQTMGTNYDYLVREIEERAQGVFLWVRLVVRSLKSGLTNDDPVRLLLQRLEDIPTDLEEFFELILGSVDSIYRRRMACAFTAALESSQPLKITHYSFLDELEDDPNFGFHFPFEPLALTEIHRRVIQAQRRLNGRYKGLLEPCSSTDLTKDTTVDFLHRTLRDFLLTTRMRAFLNQSRGTTCNILPMLVQVSLAEAKLIPTNPAPENFSSTLALAREVAEKMKSPSYEYEIIDHVGESCHFMQALEPQPATRYLMLDVAIHVGRIDYLEYGLKSCPLALKNYLLLHSTLCPGFPGGKFENVLPFIQRIVESDTKSPGPTWPLSGSLSYCHASPDGRSSTKAKPSPALVRLLLESGADPNAKINGTSTWPEFLIAFVKQVEQRDYPLNWEVFQLFISHGADIHQQSERCITLVKCGLSFPGGQFHLVMATLTALLDHGLGPNSVYEGRSLWLEFLFRIHRIDQAKEDIENLKDVIRSFLKHGASLFSLSTPSSHEPGPSWLHDISEKIASGGTCMSGIYLPDLFEILLSHGLDPNSSLASCTLWIHLLTSILTSLDNTKDTVSHQMYYDVILLFLRYGAHAHAKEVGDVLARIRQVAHRFSESYIRDIEEAIQREKQYQESQVAMSIDSSLACKLSRPNFYQRDSARSESFNHEGRKTYNKRRFMAIDEVMNRDCRQHKALSKDSIKRKRSRR